MTARDETPDVALSAEELEDVERAHERDLLDGIRREPWRTFKTVERIIAARVAASEAARAEAEARVAAGLALADAWDERRRPGMVGISKAIRAALTGPAEGEGSDR